MGSAPDSSDLTDAIGRLGSADDPLAAIDAVRVVREEAERLENELVRNARAQGISWSRIGALYGLTKQGAQQRFRPKKEKAEKPD